jgi:hypothetical protein
MRAVTSSQARVGEVPCTTSQKVGRSPRASVTGWTSRTRSPTTVVTGTVMRSFWLRGGSSSAPETTSPSRPTSVETLFSVPSTASRQASTPWLEETRASLSTASTIARDMMRIGASTTSRISSASSSRSSSTTTRPMPTLSASRRLDRPTSWPGRTTMSSGAPASVIQRSVRSTR